MKINLDDIERCAREWDNEDAEWYPGVGPGVTLALIARIRDLEATLRRVLVSATAMSVGATWRSELDAEREILEKGVVVP